MKILLHLIALLPAGWFGLRYVLGLLSPNPLQDVTFFTGDWALRWLMASLACTPLLTLTRHKLWPYARKWLGLYGFFYALTHFLIFIGLDYRFDLELIWLDLASKRYILIGSAALLLLMPLAITSTRGWQKRLGKAWKRLHLLVYAAVPLTVLHYAWLVKGDLREPLAWAALFSGLMALRIPAIRQRLSHLGRAH